MNFTIPRFGKVFATIAILAATQATAQEVKITEDLPQFEYSFGGKTYVIARDQNPDARIPDTFAKTSRPCPEFCVQPMLVAEGVNTVAELELLTFMKDVVESEKGFLIDSRTADWYAKGTIPGAVNLTFNVFVPGPENVFYDSVMMMLGGEQSGDGTWMFDDPKDLLLFCNGPWCEQSPNAIHNLIAINYPPEKLHYYRGGMQSWVGMGLTVEIPE